MEDNLPFGPNVAGKWTVGSTEAGNTLTVSLAPGKHIPADMPWKMAFMLQRPATDPFIARISIADELGAPVVVDQVLNATTEESEYHTAEFLEVSMSEDSNVMSSLSNLTLSVSLSSPLLSIEDAGATITVSGLTGFPTPSGYLRLRGENAYMFGKNAVVRWSREESQLVFEGVSLPCNCFPPSDTCWLPARWSVTLQLTTRSSPASGQALPFIKAGKGFLADVSGFGATYIPGVPLNRATVAPRIQRASVTQNSAIQGARNNLTLSFQVDTSRLSALL